jgi:hypothetical protein
MEELNKTHKDVPFGWLAMLTDFLAARAERRMRNGARRRWDARLPLPSLPGDLHHLAGPH